METKKRKRRKAGKDKRERQKGDICGPRFRLATRFLSVPNGPFALTANMFEAGGGSTTFTEPVVVSPHSDPPAETSETAARPKE